MKKHLYTLIAVNCVLLCLAVFLPFAFAAVTGSGSEDWPMYHHDAGHTGFSTVAGPSTPKVLWSFSTSGNFVESSPAVVDGKLYVGSENGNIYCLDAKTGKQVWLNLKINSIIRSSPAVSNRFLYVPDENSLFYCIDAQTGEVNWTFSMGAWSSSSPTVSNGYIYFSSADKKMYCLDALTGQEIWDFNIGSLEPSIAGDDWTSPSTACGFTSPAVVDDRVYIGGTNLYCLDAGSGTLIWSYPIIVSNAPAVSEGKVYFCSWQGDAYCLDAETGAMVWQKLDIGRGKGPIGPAIVDDRVYFAGLVHCLNASNGKEIWHYSTGNISTKSPPIVAGPYAYFCASDGYTYCVDALTGEYVWKSKASFSSSPAVVDGVLYVGGDSLVAFSDSGKIPTAESEPSTHSNILTPELVIAFTVVAICMVIVIAYLANRKDTASSVKWKRVFTVPVTMALISIILTSSFASLYLTRSTPSQEEPSSPEFPPASSLLWQTEIAHFATSIAVGDGKVFVTTPQGTFAYSTQDGQFIWSTEDQTYIIQEEQFNRTTKDQGQSGAQVYEGSVYAGSTVSMVYRLNETNGKVITYYHAPATSSYASKGQARFSLDDGKVFALNQGIAVYDMDNGGLYWQIRFTEDLPEYTLGELGISETNRLGYVYVFGGSRVDVNNGETLWDTGGWADGNLVVDDRVILWNFQSNADQPFIIRCVNALTGQTLWDFETGIPVYEPVVYDDLLIFGASEGYLWALNLADASLAWKTLVDVDGWIVGNNLPAKAKSLSEPSVSSIVVDEQTGVGFWGFLVTQHQIEGINGDNLYVGRVCSFDLLSGDILKTTEVQTTCTLSNNSVALAPGEDALFLRAGLDLWTIDRATFDPTQIQHWEHTISGPVLGGDRVYVATDLYLSAYR